MNLLQLRPAPAETGAVDLAVLFRDHAQTVHRYCARRCGDLDLAQDLTSVTFLEAWRHRDRIPPGDPLPWLLGVATNVCRNARRGARRQSAALARVPAPSDEPDHALAVAERAEAAVRLKQAVEALAALPRRERDVVALVLWEGLSYADAAAALAIPVGTVRSRLSRGRARLLAAVPEEDA